MIQKLTYLCGTVAAATVAILAVFMLKSQGQAIKGELAHVAGTVHGSRFTIQRCTARGQMPVGEPGRAEKGTVRGAGNGTLAHESFRTQHSRFRRGRFSENRHTPLASDPGTSGHARGWSVQGIDRFPILQRRSRRRRMIRAQGVCPHCWQM